MVHWAALAFHFQNLIMKVSAFRGLGRSKVRVQGLGCHRSETYVLGLGGVEAYPG